jgi:hypothetical protein
VPCPAVDYGFAVPVANGSGYSRGTPPPPAWNPAQPANVPANEFGMMADVFGQMIGAKSPPAYLPPPPMPPVAVQTLGYVIPPVPEGACPPCPLPTSTRPSVTGTWVREVGPVVYVVKIAPDHLTISVTAATEVGGGKLMTQELVLAADYHLSRDGTTLVGLITGVDSTVNGELTGDSHADLQALQEELSQLQKGYTDKPYAMTVRVYGDSLVIGNVRLPQAKDVQDSDTPLGIIGGRYRNVGDKMFPKPKPTRVNAPRAAAPCAGRVDCLIPTDIPVPSPPYATSLPGTSRLPADDCPAPRPAPAPVYELPPGPPAGPAPSWSPAPPSPRGYAPPVPQQSPRPSLAPPVSVPAPGAVPRELDKVTLPPDNRTPPPSPAVAPAVPPMAVPTPPVLLDAPKANKKKKKAAQALPGILLNQYSSDPDVRMQQLLYQRDDLGGIKNEWRRFWFNDQPGQVIERIHGGIIGP